MDSSLLPVAEPEDSSDTRWALETARTLWGQGERREALQWVRRAAEAAAEAGADDRALILAKMGAELRSSLDIPRTVPPPAVASATFDPPTIPKMPPAAAMPAIENRVASRPVASPVAPRPVAPPAASPVVSSPVAPPPSLRLGTPVGPPSSSDSRGDTELVVTVVSTDGSTPPASGSLVSHRAVRVAVMAVEPGARELRVRRLADGEVAPKDATVALLVAFEPGTPPVP